MGAVKINFEVWAIFVTARCARGHKYQCYAPASPTQHWDFSISFAPLTRSKNFAQTFSVYFDSTQKLILIYPYSTWWKANTDSYPIYSSFCFFKRHPVFILKDEKSKSSQNFDNFFCFCFQKSFKIIFPDCKRIEKWLASRKIQFEWLLKAKTEKVVKNLGRFGFFILWNKNRMSLLLAWSYQNSVFIIWT